MGTGAAAVRGWLRNRAEEAVHNDPFLPTYWDPQVKSPELAKALALVQRHVAEARNLLDIEDGQAPLRTAEVRQRLRDLLTREVSRLSIDSAWELANHLKRELLLLGDVAYVWAQLEYEVHRDKMPQKWHRWSDHFAPKRLRKLIEMRDNGTVDLACFREAVFSLRKLYELRAEAGLERRTRAAQKCRYLTALIPILLLLLVALSAAVYEDGPSSTWKGICLAASAGALGATLSGIFRVRDRLIELDDLRSFWPAMRIQPLIGATAGLVMLLMLETGAVNFGGTNTTRASWAASALLAFLAGFSEPFFLGLVQRIAVVPDKDPTLAAAS